MSQDGGFSGRHHVPPHREARKGSSRPSRRLDCLGIDHIVAYLLNWFHSSLNINHLDLKFISFPIEAFIVLDPIFPAQTAHFVASKLDCTPPISHPCLFKLLELPPPTSTLQRNFESDWT